MSPMLTEETDRSIRFAMPLSVLPGPISMKRATPAPSI